MGFPGYARSLRASLAYVGMAAATASALVVLQSGVAFAAGAITVTKGSDTAVSVVEARSTGLKNVATFTDSGNPPIVIGAATLTVVTCDSLAQARYSATIDWSGDGTDTGPGVVRCTDTEGTWAVWGAHNYKDSGTFHINVTVSDKSDAASASGTAMDTATVTVTDAALEWDGDNSRDGSFAAVEGKSVKVAVDFFDNANAESARDASITGTIDWGDGSAVQTVQSTDASDICDCNSNDPEISASHVYDSAALYHITVTAKDDGGSTATATFSANISDGKLTADPNKSLTATAGAALTSVLGSFTDEAAGQAAAGDFAAMISWGDGSLYSGTVAKTASGAFSVSGTHTYASAGSKSITATVTDEEGNTVTLHATAAVGAAPIVLPATGQPHPTLPAVPVIPVALLILCLASLAVGGRILAKMPR
jgi:hypothetical protein